jgi:signal recognition particle receptor subunit beta
MNVETSFLPDTDQRPALSDEGTELIGQGLSALDPLAKTRDTLTGILDGLIKLGDRATAERARKLSARLNDVEPAITMVGQVKAGKTSLVNAMIGMPGLLPSDVNPWTSVVTSLHLDPSMTTAQNRASFEFFNRMDWDRLIVGGGRIGELARRAGAASELERVTEQVAALREASRKRLGNKFEMLLGQEHDYGYFDRDLIERYVCLGDDFEDDTETSKSRGRFADITKSAEIHMHNPAAPVRLCFRDTPGVNDTFLVREQITMKAVRGSQICVMVLAAHQALSTVDMALMRLISNVKSRDVVIFVNRIDELADPATQVPEIRASIQKTLAKHQGPEDVTILFGSAHWANLLLEERLSELDSQSAEALLNYTRAMFDTLPVGASETALVWHLSGVGALHQVLAERIAKGSGASSMAAIERSTRNLLNGIKVSSVNGGAGGQTTPLSDVDIPAAIDEFNELEKQGEASLDMGLNKLKEDFAARIARVHDSFLDRATAALIQHLETSPEGTVWTYDPTGLRMLLRSSYRTFAKRSNDVVKSVLATANEDSAEFFERTFSMETDSYEMDPPEPLNAPEPVILSQTIALDLESSWWASWWEKQAGAKEQRQKFSKLIAAETAPILTALQTDYAATIRNEAESVLRDFVSEQRQVLNSLTRQNDSNGSSDQVSRRQSKRLERMDLVDQSLATLEQLSITTGE